jgi:hypothetical protein
LVGIGKSTLNHRAKEPAIRNLRVRRGKPYEYDREKLIKLRDEGYFDRG